MVVVIACHTVVSGEPFSDKEVVKIFPRFSLITFLIFFCVKELNAEYLQGKTHGDCHNLLILLGIVSREKIKLIRLMLEAKLGGDPLVLERWIKLMKQQVITCAVNGSTK